jgi:hypothetical protein
MSNRLRGIFLNGIVTSITAGNPGTLILASGLNLAIPSGYYLPIVLNPPPYAQVSGTTVLSEIVWTSGTYSLGTSSFTVLRAQETSSSLGAQTNIPYAVGPTPQDFGITNWQTNGDFPTPTISGSFLVATNSGVSTPTWTFGYLVPSGGTTGQIVSISGGVPILTNTISGINFQGLTISGNNVYGNLSNATISGSQIVGTITSISGYLPNVSVSGSQVWGNLPNSTISGSQVVGTINANQVSGTLTKITSISGTYNYGTLTSGVINGSLITNSTISGSTFTGNTLLNTTFSGSILNYVTITSPIENVNLSSQGIPNTGVIFNLGGGSVNFFPIAASGNFTVNATWLPGIQLNSVLSTGQSISFVLLNTNGPTAYYLTGFQIDGVNTGLHWQGGTAPTQGNPSATDYYSFSIIKTNNSPTYWVTAGLTKVV